MNNIINKNTRPCYGIVVNNNETCCKNFVAFIAGATIYVSLPREIYKKCKVGDAFKGCINLISREMVDPEYLGLYRRGTSPRKTRGVSGKPQSVRQPIDAYLVRCKHQLVRKGIYAGEKGWDESLDDATELWNVVNGTSFPRSRDTKMWFRK